MKSAALLLIIYITLASCHFSFLETYDSAIEDPEKNRDNIVDFFEGVFSYFNLSSPSQINDCFCDTNAGMYFKLIQQIGDILKDTKERNSVKLHLEYGKIAILFHSLKDTHACIAMTQDFTDLLDTLNIKKRNPDEFKTFLYFYYQAHYSDLFEGFKPILDNLNTQSHKAAGDAFGAVINDTVMTIKQEGLGGLALAGFANGGSIALDIDEPNDSLQCFDKESSGLVMEFTYGLAAAVANGNFKEGALNAIKFMHGDGKEIYEKIPKEDFECEANSDDSKKISGAIGFDITSMEFHDLMVKYIFDNRFHYYVFSKTLKNALENGNLHHAGSIYYHFLKSIASSK